MATDKTPPHKRIERAEQSAANWKMKSIERREEAERLNLKIKGLEEKIAKTENKIIEQNTQMESLKHDLQQAQLTISKQHGEIEELKKNVFKRPKTI